MSTAYKVSKGLKVSRDKLDEVDEKVEKIESSQTAKTKSNQPKSRDKSVKSHKLARF